MQPVHVKRRQVSVITQLQPYGACADDLLRDAADRRGELLGRYRLQPGGAGAEELAQPAHHFGGPVRLAQHLLDDCRELRLRHAAPAKQRERRLAVTGERGERLVDLVGDGAGHLAGGSEPQALAQALGRALALVHHDAQIQAGQSEPGDERLDLDDREGGNRVAAQAGDDAQLHQRRGADRSIHAAAHGDPDEGKKEQVEMIPRIAAQPLEDEPHRRKEHDDLQRSFGPAREREQTGAPLAVGGCQQQRRGDQYSHRVADPEAQPRGRQRRLVELGRAAQRADERAADERRTADHHRAKQRELARRAQSGMAEQLAQDPGDHGVAAAENHRGEQHHEVAARRAAHQQVGDEDRRQHDRRVLQAAEQHPDDGERRLRIPGRDVERADGVDVARPVQRDVARCEHRGVANIADRRNGGGHPGH